MNAPSTTHAALAPRLMAPVSVMVLGIKVMMERINVNPKRPMQEAPSVWAPREGLTNAEITSLIKRRSCAGGGAKKVNVLLRFFPSVRRQLLPWFLRFYFLGKEMYAFKSSSHEYLPDCIYLYVRLSILISVCPYLLHNICTSHNRFWITSCCVRVRENFMAMNNMIMMWPK